MGGPKRYSPVSPLTPFHGKLLKRYDFHLTQHVFISHAGDDSSRAQEIASILASAGIQVRFDRHELCLGESFLAFMENALSQSDYCLLLWSQKAAATPWVRMEWEAALYRSIAENRAFLVVGRLENIPVPALLSPRLRVDLFPEVQPGVGQIVEVWCSDRMAEDITKRPVASVHIDSPAGPNGRTVYVTSEAFGITVPIQVDLDEPAAMIVDDLIDRAHLPTTWHYESRIGVRFDYELVYREDVLEPGRALSSQHVTDKSILWLKTKMSSFSLSPPIGGDLRGATFRGGEDRLAVRRALSAGRHAYVSAVNSAGLGSRPSGHTPTSQ